MRIASALVLVFAAGCSSATSAPPSASPSAPSVAAAPSTTERAIPQLVPERGTSWFGMNLDWANDSVAEASERLGVTPSVWVQFVAFPLDEGGRANLDAFVEQVAAVDGIGLVTLEPHAGLDAVTVEAAEEVARVLDGYWQTSGTPTIVRFAHEMNGSWYPWGQQPEPYVRAFRTVAKAIHELAPASAMAWAPNEGSGYPFTGGAFAFEDPALDTNGDGEISRADDPYAPYWPGDDAVDWVGMSLYHWGLEHPWGENELPAPGSFRAQLTDFYAAYADGHDKPLGIFETAALYNPEGDGPAEAELKSAWWRQVTDPAIRDEFPRLAMLNWFEWRKEEPEVGGVIDWRLTSDPELARELIGVVPEGWLIFGGLAGR